MTVGILEETLQKGDYAKFLEYTGTMCTAWLLVGDRVYATLLTEAEQEQVVGGEAQDELEQVAKNYMRELWADGA